MERIEAIERILVRYGREYMLRQLAEECAELTHAALKLIRAERRETQISETAARAAFMEELADVRVMWDAAVGVLLSPTDSEDVDRIRDMKELRMIDRLL